VCARGVPPSVPPRGLANITPTRIESLSGVRARQRPHALLLVVTTAEPRRGCFDQRQFTRAIRYEGMPLDERVELELPLGRAPPQGARVSLLARVAAPRGPSHGLNERTGLRRQGVHVVLRVDRFAVDGRRGGLGGVGDRLRRWLGNASTPGLAGERRALIDGIVLGDYAGVSDGLKQAFRRSGLYHLLAVAQVSGRPGIFRAAGLAARRRRRLSGRSGRGAVVTSVK
jgi:hypothetical protein